MTDSTPVSASIDFMFLDGRAEGVQPGIVVETGDIIGRFNRGMGMTVLLVVQKRPFVRVDQFCVFDRGRPVASGQAGEFSRVLIKEYLTV